ncbi:MAG TPA: hypothetical protein VFZ01_00710 [Geminicoccaceae bacterium]
MDGGTTFGIGAGADGRARAGGRDGTGPLAMTLIVLGFVLIWLAAAALAVRLMMLPAEASGRLYVAFPPGTGEAGSYAMIVAAGGRPIGPALGGWSWEAYGEEAGFVGRLEDQGALVAFRTTPLGVPLAGCLGMFQPPERRPGLSPGL